jgi:hypothetical protein
VGSPQHRFGEGDGPSFALVEVARIEYQATGITSLRHAAADRAHLRRGAAAAIDTELQDDSEQSINWPQPPGRDIEGYGSPAGQRLAVVLGEISLRLVAAKRHTSPGADRLRKCEEEPQGLLEQMLRCLRFESSIKAVQPHQAPRMARLLASAPAELFAGGNCALGKVVEPTCPLWLGGNPQPGHLLLSPSDDYALMGLQNRQQGIKDSKPPVAVVETDATAAGATNPWIAAVQEIG